MEDDGIYLQGIKSGSLLLGVVGVLGNGSFVYSWAAAFTDAGIKAEESSDLSKRVVVYNI